MGEHGRAMRKKTFGRGRFLGAAGAFASIGLVGLPARAAEFSFKWGNATPIDHPLTVRQIQIADAIKKATKGRFEIAIFYNSQLGGDTAMLSQVRSGALQLYSGFGGIYAIIAPIAGIEAIGFAFRTQKEALATLDGPLGAYIRKDMETKGLHVFERPWVNGFRQVTTSTHPVALPPDFSGLKIRTPNAKIWIDLFQTLGAAPTPIDANEMYTALQTKVVDAQENPYAIIETYKLYEVQKYISVTNHMFSSFWAVANPEAYAGLPSDYQKLLTDAINAAALQQRNDMQELNESLADKLHRRGMIINQVDQTPFRAKLTAGGFYARWKETYGATAWSLLEASVGKLG